MREKETYDEELPTCADGCVGREYDCSEAEWNRGVQPLEGLFQVFCLKEIKQKHRGRAVRVSSRLLISASCM